MIRLLLCGSSHRRRGAGGWTDRAPLVRLLDALQPDVIAHGASPSGGLDALAEEVGAEHFRARGLDPDERVRRFPMDPAFDGEGGAAFMRRNARMGEHFRPTLGAAFVTGRVGQAVGTRGNYLSNGTANMVDWLHARRVPVVVVREDGIEPYSSVKAARSQIWCLGKLTGDATLGPVWHTLDALIVSPSMWREALTALACARETSRFAAWIEACEATVRRTPWPGCPPQ